jgi:hypothetical protein
VKSDKSAKLRRKERFVDKDSAEFHKELLDNEDGILAGLRKIISIPERVDKK